ncbi:MAG: dienelactone hydrolase family protein, partial [Deltaproteobacteria bacterium]|nr:dienelactone hydrolase family protein [Deltaproteobacteria bacterium]
MQLIERLFNTKDHGVAGFLAHPQRTEPGPALLLIHPKGGLTDYIKIEARKFAALGYSTFAPNVFEQLGYPEPTHIVSGGEIQAKTSDDQFDAALTESWRFLLSQPHVDNKRVAVS